jgi:hypothetical protein
VSASRPFVPCSVRRTHHHAVVEPVVPVVVAYECGAPARDGGLRAAREKGRRVPQRQDRAGMLVVHHLRQPPPRRYQLGHVLGEPLARLPAWGPGVAALAEPPLAQRRVRQFDLLGVLVAGLVLGPGGQRQFDGPRGGLLRSPRRPRRGRPSRCRRVPSAKSASRDQSMRSPSRLQSMPLPLPPSLVATAPFYLTPRPAEWRGPSGCRSFIRLEGEESCKHLSI